MEKRNGENRRQGCRALFGSAAVHEEIRQGFIEQALRQARRTGDAGRFVVLLHDENGVLDGKVVYTTGRDIDLEGSTTPKSGEGITPIGLAAPPSPAYAQKHRYCVP